MVSSALFPFGLVKTHLHIGIIKAHAPLVDSIIEALHLSSRHR